MIQLFTLECIPNDPINNKSGDGLVLKRQLAVNLTSARKESNRKKGNRKESNSFG